MFNLIKTKNILVQIFVFLLIISGSQIIFADNECADLIEKKKYYEAIDRSI